MNEYHKIQTVYLRDPDTKFKTLLLGEYALPEFMYLAFNEWIFTEKVDGTNIRIMLDGQQIIFGGKTNDAQIPAPLLANLQNIFLPQIGVLKEKFSDGVCLYGEGYGAKIQKGGGNYRPDQGFVLFDVKIGDFWLERNNVEDIAKNLGIEVVPIIGSGTLVDMVDKAAIGFKSVWGDFQAEGIVARPAVGLKARNGARIIAKIKHKDFAKIA